MDLIFDGYYPKYCVLLNAKYDIKNPFRKELLDLEASCIIVDKNNEGETDISINTMDKSYLDYIDKDDHTQREYQLLVNLLSFYDKMSISCMIRLGKYDMHDWILHFFTLYKTYSSPNIDKIINYRLHHNKLSSIVWQNPINIHTIQQFLESGDCGITIHDLKIEDLGLLLEIPVKNQDIWISLLECLFLWNKKYSHKMSQQTFLYMIYNHKIDFVFT